MPSCCGIRETLQGLTTEGKLSNEQHNDCSFALHGTKRNVLTFDQQFSLANILSCINRVFFTALTEVFVSVNFDFFFLQHLTDF